MSAMDVVEIVGALAILAAFAGAQVKKLTVTSWRYLVLNAAGSGVLAAIALSQRSWGFVLLEGVWAIVSIVGIIVKAADRRPSGAH